jgi:hypothetical protein
MFNMFSGGALHRFSLFALNVMPYISASIIVQLLTQIVPSLKAIQKEGESAVARSTSGRAWVRSRWLYSRRGALPLRCRPAAPQWHRSRLQPGPVSSDRRDLADCGHDVPDVAG